MADEQIHIMRALYPFSWLYGMGVWVRNRLFDAGVLREHRFDVPVISVGNLTVGGTGKTPHTEYLLRLLSRQCRVAVLSRGYKRASKGFLLAGPETDVRMLGDEPFQMKQKFPQVHVAVDADRCHGIRQLCSETVSPATEVVVLDDAYQHRYVKPGLNILLVNYHRMIDRDALLPAGRLREPASGKKRADVVIVTKCPSGLGKDEADELARRLALSPHQPLYFTTLVYGKLRLLFASGQDELPLTDIGTDKHLLLVTGIASPAGMIKDLSPYSKHIVSLPFADHHSFTSADLERIRQRFMSLPRGERMIVTTEKDAVRLASHPSLDEELKPYIYVLPIEVSFLFDRQESFNLNITHYVTENSRNRSFS